MPILRIQGGLFRLSLAWALGGRTGHPLADEAPEAIAAHETRLSNAFAALRQRFDAAAPKALVVVCTDSGRLFSNVQVPQFCTFLGEDLWGSTTMSELGEPAEGHVVHLSGAPELAEFIQQELVDVGFDMNYARELRPMGQPDYGAPAALVEPVVRLGLQAIPVVAIFVNVHRRPRSQRTPVLRTRGCPKRHPQKVAGAGCRACLRWALPRLPQRPGGLG